MNITKKVRLSYSLLLVLVLLLFSSNYKTILVYLISYFFHEIGHVIVIYIVTKKPIKINLNVISSNIEITNTLSYQKNILIYLGGVLFNLVLFILFFYLYKYYKYDFIKQMYLFNLFLIFMNLAPIFPLDGFYIVLNLTVRFHKLSYITLILNYTFILLFIAISIKYEITYLVFMAMYLLFKNVCQIKQVFDIIYISKVGNKLWLLQK